MDYLWVRLANRYEDEFSAGLDAQHLYGAIARPAQQRIALPAATDIGASGTISVRLLPTIRPGTAYEVLREVSRLLGSRS